MKIWNIGICDNDISYASELMERINRRYGQEFKAFAFSRMTSVQEFLTVSDLDVILTDDTASCTTDHEDFRYSFCGIKCIPLTQDMERPVFKYQRVSLIVDELKKEIKPSAADRRTSRVLGVYSPIARCGKTRLAMALAADDDVRGGLYVGMEDYSGADCAASPDLLYLVNQRSPELKDRLSQEIIRTEALGYLYASGAYMDTRDVLRDDIQWLSETILQTGRYTTICYDFGTASIADLSILKTMDEIYVPVLTDHLSENKLRVFQKLLRDMELSSIEMKLRYIEVPDVEYDSAEMIRAIWRTRNG